MKTGEKLTFFYIPNIGFINGETTLDEGMKIIREAESRAGIEDDQQIHESHISLEKE